MKGIIDRFEGNFAVIELDGRIMKNIEVSVLPAGIKEGDAIVLANGKWQFDLNETVKLKAEIKKLAEDLFE